jgi:adenylate cyclase class IV
MQYEVEMKSLVHLDRHRELIKQFKSQFKESKQLQRYSLIYCSNKDLSPDTNEQIDLRVKINNGTPTLTIKYGDWKKPDAREEYEVTFKKDELHTLLKMLKIFGYQWGITLLVDRIQFETDNLVITCDHYHGEEKHIIEVERVIDDKRKNDKALKDIEDFMLQYKIKPLNQEEYVTFIKHINSRKDWRFDFEDNSIDKFNPITKCD